MPGFVPKLLLLVLLIPVFAAAEEIRCASVPDVVVRSVFHDSVDEVCQAADKALDYLARLKLLQKRTIFIDITEEPIVNQGLHAYGRYDSRSDRIELMSYAAIRRNLPRPMMYGEPFDDVHFTGAIAHEVAHAVMQQNLKTELISPSPQEYLAHATQMAVLPDARRTKILRELAVDPWVSGDAISDVYLGIEPNKFAAKSYQHLTALADPAAFVAILLNAKWFYIYVP